MPALLHSPYQLASGKGVRVGLIDTGVDSDHRELAGRITANYEAIAFPDTITIEKVDSGTDHNDHGTACAAILNKAAPDAMIHSVQVIGEYSSDIPEKLISGLEFAVEQGWEVINVNAGAAKPRPQIQHLVEQAHAAGILIIAAKDNRPGVIGYPAAYPEVICVDMEFLPDPLAWKYHPGAEIEVEANGIYINAPIPGGGRASHTGSSFAAPTIAGIAARFKELHPNAGMPEFREFLMN